MAKTQSLHSAVVELERTGQILQLPNLSGREWYEVLLQKLLPQLTDSAFLVVAVVGGTNIGKSVVFNHIAGCRASATSPLASGTRHPVCLVPPGFSQQHDLQSIFPCFQLEEWSDPEAALKDHPEDRLFWRTSSDTPDNLLVLDTPDIDSDARVNWRRADNIRRCADVLIAVLTQQKYNDAAVKQFFRKAAREDKSVILVFNQCQLPEDEEYWPLWLDTFCSETQVRPEFLYVVPNDRQAAEQNTLPFFERPVSASPNGSSVEVSGERAQTRRDLSTDLSRLRFGEIKLRTLHGAFRNLLDPEHGVSAYLREVEQRSGEFQLAAEMLAAQKLASIDNWPSLQNKLMISAIRSWWQSQREGWPAKIHNFYNALGTGLTWPIRLVRKRVRGAPEPPIELYRSQEWNAILDTVQKVYEQLQCFHELGNARLKPRLERLLGGTTRTDLVRTLHREHTAIDFEEELAAFISQEMNAFRQESPEHYRFLKRLDSIGAAVRPATSIVFFVTGFGPVGHAATQLAADTAMQSVIHVAGDVAGGTLAATVGESAVSTTAATGAGYLEAKFRNLHTGFTAQRVRWLTDFLKQHLLGNLPRELQTAAEVTETGAYRAAQNALADLEVLIDITFQAKAV